MAYRLHVRFEDSNSFRTEFERNVAMGGAFVPTGDLLELRSFLEVVFELAFCDESVILEAEVVHLIPPERALNPGDAGVAVSFRKPASELREMFAAFLGDETPELTDSAPILAEQVVEDPDLAGDLPIEKPVKGSQRTPETRFEVVPDGIGSPGFSNLEASILDLARAGLEVARILEIIPEESGDVHRAIEKLLEREVLRIHGAD